MSAHGRTPIRLLGIVGTRPEAIKTAPLALAARRDPRLDYRTLHTGQHGALFEAAFAAFELSADERLTVAPHDGSVDAMVAAIRAAVAERLRRDPPDLVLVQGDTNSALAGALAARDNGVPIAHVEAGLRSGDADRPWPEERNRIAIDAIADLLFAPTTGARDNVDREGVPGATFVTGNTGIDAVLTMRDRLAANPTLSRLDALIGGDRRPFVLATCHRREAIGAPLVAICIALRTIADRGDIRPLVPLHPNPAIRGALGPSLADHPAITLTDPLDYPTTVDAMRRARLILTDSGGIQEEAPALGTPVLVLREVTERPEALATGNLKLVGHDPVRIIGECSRLIVDDAAHAAMSCPAFPYGDGTTAAQILDHIAQFFSAD